MTSAAPQPHHVRPPAGFAVSIDASPGLVRVRVVGELDVWTAPALVDALTWLPGVSGIRARLGRSVELDLSGLDFMDTAGLTALADSRLALRSAGWNFRLVRARPHIGRLLAYATSAGWLAADALEPGAG